MSNTQGRRWLLTGAVGVWVVVVSAGAWALARYAGTAGPAVNAAQMWPVTATIHRVVGEPNLVMSLHPQCPCSRASVNELDVLMARCPGQFLARVLLIDYPGMKSDVTTSELWKMASRIPGVICVRDESGTVSSEFHAETSGQVFLYDADGSLEFNGGITSARGHAGDNDGLLAVEAILHRAVPTTRSTPVFGCTLR